MEKRKSLEKFQSDHKHIHKSSSGCRCANCGATVESGAKFCEECGAPVDEQGVVLCTFCGSPRPEGVAFCENCGNPPGGVFCPNCGALNYRNFCRCCNTPLTAAALAAVDAANKDPKFIKAKKLSQEIDELEDEIERLRSEISSMPVQEIESVPEKLLEIDSEESAEARALREEFETLCGIKPAMPKRAEKAEQPKTKPAAQKLTLNESVQTEKSDFFGTAKPKTDPRAEKLARLMEMHRQKLDELQKTMDEMIPDPGLPPEDQRDYVCARMIRTQSVSTKTITSRVAWVCNRCGIWHNNPSECGVREFGGKWVTQSRTVRTVVEKNQSINI